MSATNATPAEPPKESRRCRALRVNGVQCNSIALRGHDLCHTHKYYGRPECPKKGSKIVMPLLDDHSSIQLVISQVAQGLFSGTLHPAEARALSYCCQVAAYTLPRPVSVRPPATQQNTRIPEAVAEVFSGPDGQPLGPIEKYCGPTGSFEPQWSVSKYMYEQQCIKLGKPIPTCAADFPASGWLTEDEIKEDPHDFAERYRARIREADEHNAKVRDEETAAALAAGRPDPHAHLKRKNPKCPFDTDWCNGPAHKHHCNRCSGDYAMDPSNPRYPGDAVIAELRERYWGGKDPKPFPEDPPSSPVDLKACAEPAPVAHRQLATRRKHRRTPAAPPRRGDIELDNPTKPHIPRTRPRPHPQGGGGSPAPCKRTSAPFKRTGAQAGGYPMQADGCPIQARCSLEWGGVANLVNLSKRRQRMCSTSRPPIRLGKQILSS